MRSVGKYNTAVQQLQGGLCSKPPPAKSRKNIKAMQQGTQDWDWDTLWQRFALGLKPLESDRKQTHSPSKSQLQPGPQLLPSWDCGPAELGIQCLAAPLAPEVKEKITQPGLGTIMLIPGNLNAKLSTKAKGQL